MVEALRGVSLTIDAASATGVIGPNGAGKSTLFALILGFLKPSSGSVSIRGLQPRDFMRRHGASYLPERFSLPGAWPVLTALETLARLDRVDNAERRVAEVIDRLGLGEHADKPVRGLSRGLLQRLGIAQCLLAKRELVVLDEPTEGLDPVWRLRLREIITELRAGGATLLIASHELGEVERLVDSAILLDNGTIRETMTIAHKADAPRRYAIRLRNEIGDATEFFPGASLRDHTLLVDVSDSADLSARLAALLERGAIVESVQPADNLEQRVRSALESA